MHDHLVLDYLSASGKVRSKTLDHIHKVIPKSLPVLCKMATADNSDITVHDNLVIIWLAVDCLGKQQIFADMNGL